MPNPSKNRTHIRLGWGFVRFLPLLVLVWVPVAFGQTLYWDTNGNTAGAGATPTGTWRSSTKNWTTDASGNTTTAGYTSGSDVVFSAGTDAIGTFTVTVSGTQNVSSIYVEEGTPTFSSGTINFNDATPDFTVASGLQATVNSTISGSNGLNKLGFGTLVLAGSNSSYTGATAINAGTVLLTNANALGTSSNTGSTTVASGATLQLTGGITTANSGTLILNGTGSGSGALQSLSGTNKWNSDITIASNSTIYSSVAGSTLYLGNSSATSLFTMGSNTVTFDGPGDTWVYSNAGVIGDTGGLIKNGTGKLTFYGYNTFYTGATIVNAGSLDLTVGPFSTGYYGINGSLTIGTGPSSSALAGTVNVNIAYNSYANQISPTSAVTINSDGALNVGSSTGMGALTLNGGQITQNGGTNVSISPTSITANANSAHQTSSISGVQLALSGATLFTVARDATLTSDLTINSTISGGSIVKQGDGILTLTSANTLTGTSINAGAINAQASNALGTTNSVTVASGAALQVQGGINLGQTSTTLNGTGLANTGALQNVSGNNALTNGVVLGSASSINSDAGTLTLSGGLTTAGNDLTIGGAGNTTLGGTLSFGSTDLTKTDAGTLTFNSSLDLSSGTLTLNAGTLALNGTTLTVGTLHITGDSILDFGSATASTLSVTNFIIDAGVSLTINNWSDAVDYFYAQNWSGAVSNTTGSTPMNQITFNSFSNNSTKWLSYDKQVTPVPEASTYGIWLMTLSALAFAWHRRKNAAHA